jgi:hypothetical protein
MAEPGQDWLSHVSELAEQIVAGLAEPSVAELVDATDAGLAEPKVAGLLSQVWQDCLSHLSRKTD